MPGRLSAAASCRRWTLKFDGINGCRVTELYTRLQIHPYSFSFLVELDMVPSLIYVGSWASQTIGVRVTQSDMPEVLVNVVQL